MFFHTQINATELKLLRQNDNVFFLHLLGIDTNGHAKNTSFYNENNNNIRFVDNIVREVTEKISQRYKNDKKK